jgi:DNA-directed RNA polymerase subunit RPC12/RpoP
MKNIIIKYKGELKKIDTQEKAYLIGFLYGDGTITNTKGKYVTKISIIKTDEDLILKFKELFPFFNLGDFDYSIYEENQGKQKFIRKQSKELYMDLLLNGLYPRKSYENKNMLKIPDIDQNLIPHFIRGFFDADGSVYITKQRKNLLRFEFGSVSKTLIYDINNYLKLKDINSLGIREKPQTGKGKQLMYLIEFTKTSENLKLIDLMYKDYTIGLKRKADKCLNYKPVNKTLDRNINCPKCSSINVKQNGIRLPSIRYQCNACKKDFSIKIKNFQ